MYSIVTSRQFIETDGVCSLLYISHILFIQYFIFKTFEMIFLIYLGVRMSITDVCNFKCGYCASLKVGFFAPMPINITSGTTGALPANTPIAKNKSVAIDVNFFMTVMI